jgi:proteasome lid subunit RPN8/RPN11
MTPLRLLEPLRFRPDHRCEHRERVNVGIFGNQLDKIRRAVDDERYFEVAGWLFSRGDSIVLATPGEAANPTSAWLDPDEWDVIRRMAPDLCPCGDFHSHPSGDLLPSERDLKAWAQGAKLAGGFWFGLVLGPRRDMWSRASCAAWVTAANGGMPFTEPLALAERRCGCDAKNLTWINPGHRRRSRLLPSWRFALRNSEPALSARCSGLVIACPSIAPTYRATPSFGKDSFRSRRWREVAEKKSSYGSAGRTPVESVTTWPNAVIKAPVKLPGQGKKK